MFVCASPEWFVGKSKNQVKEWQEETLNFMIEQFGKENILYAVVHNDEKLSIFIFQFYR